MTTINCPSWEGCAAPLCPLEPLQNATWYPGEDVCNTLKFRKCHWVKIQRKIHQLYLKGHITDDYCFTVSLLEIIKAVRCPKGLRPEDLYRNGIDPSHQDVSISRQLPLK